MKPGNSWPSITAICSTYGRHARLKDAIACFLLQDYVGEKRLHILNDAEAPLWLTADHGTEIEIDDKTVISLCNAPHFSTVGAKKQSLLDAVTTDLVAHWEDDDLYLPWHLTFLTSTLLANPDHECANPIKAWRMTGSTDSLVECYVQSGNYDGQMVFYPKTAVPYRDHTRSIELPLLKDYGARKKLFLWHAALSDMSYVYRYYDGIKHLCRSGKAIENTRRRWEKLNRDFGDEVPLLPEADCIVWAKERISFLFHFLADSAKFRFDNAEAARLEKRLNLSIGEKYMEEAEEHHWARFNSGKYDSMINRHKPLWSWVRRYIEKAGVRSVIEVGGSHSLVPGFMPERGTYTNIDVNVSDEPEHKLADFQFIESDFRDVDPESLPACDLLFAAAVVEHCPHYDVFIDWALKTKAKRIVVSFFNRLWPTKEDSIRRKKVVFYNRYSRPLLEAWLDERQLAYTIWDLQTDHVLEVLPTKYLFDSRIEVAAELSVEIRHDHEQLRKLFNLLHSRNTSRMIEVGSYCGGSALLWGGLLSSPSELLLIDLCDRKKAQPFLDASMKYLQKEGVRVKLFKGNSTSIEAEEAAMAFGMVDALYIDGCHKTRVAINDYMTFRHFVRDGGLICFDDVTGPESVRLAWEHMTKAWDKQGLDYYIIGEGEWDKRLRPWASGLGVLEWRRSALEDLEGEAALQEMINKRSKVGG